MNSQDFIKAFRFTLTSPALRNIPLPLLYIELVELTGFEKLALEPSKQP